MHKVKNHTTRNSCDDYVRVNMYLHKLYDYHAKYIFCLDNDHVKNQVYRHLPLSCIVHQNNVYYISTYDIF